MVTRAVSAPLPNHPNAPSSESSAPEPSVETAESMQNHVWPSAGGVKVDASENLPAVAE